MTQPFLSPLGIPPELAVMLLFGFIVKEIVLGDWPSSTNRVKIWP
ncbi:MAG: hypothetical protein KME07_20465 [Pegethrix bostrychoides GSE-TBD4-15B]|uniref:Uncharacterized protein n=1 Tax=Pegethrix bostrychoides GSE-TBD4-15B TaxID=2839662 RepID=A0A951PDW7_9CYAN|nr:hypothetical protein [Pegethrix bostrychoides GSE-TBD4-15B]